MKLVQQVALALAGVLLAAGLFRAMGAEWAAIAAVGQVLGAVAAAFAAAGAFKAVGEMRDAAEKQTAVGITERMLAELDKPAIQDSVRSFGRWVGAANEGKVPFTRIRAAHGGAKALGIDLDMHFIRASSVLDETDRRAEAERTARAEAAHADLAWALDRIEAEPETLGAARRDIHALYRQVASFRAQGMISDALLLDLTARQHAYWLWHDAVLPVSAYQTAVNRLRDRPAMGEEWAAQLIADVQAAGGRPPRRLAMGGAG